MQIFFPTIACILSINSNNFKFVKTIGDNMVFYEQQCLYIFWCYIYHSVTFIDFI